MGRARGQGAQVPVGGGRPGAAQPPDPTVRVVRADYFTTKGQGFLYVEARTTQGAQTNPVVGMTLESDQGPGTNFISARTMSRFVDSGEYMFHRNLFKVSTRPDSIRVTSSTGGVTTGKVSDWLRDVTPLTSLPGYKSDFVDEYKHPQQLYARFEQIAQQYPDLAEIVRMPNKTNGYQRKAQATIGTIPPSRPQNPPAPSAVVISSAAWGHEGGNDITVEFVGPDRQRPAALRAGHGQGREGPAGDERNRRAVEHGGPGRGGARVRLTGPDRPRAPVPRQRRHRDRRSRRRRPWADRLPRPEAHRRARGRGPARPVRHPRAADRQSAPAPSPAY